VKELCKLADELSDVEKRVMHESQIQVEEADMLLKSMNQKQVDAAVSPLFSIVSLNKVAGHVQGLVESGVITPRKAGKCNEEVEEELDILLGCCPTTDHPGQLSEEEKERKIIPVQGEETTSGEGSGPADVQC